MANNKQLFNGLMAFLNSIGPIGENVDMSYESVDYFPNYWYTKEQKQIKLLPIFGTFIYNLIEEYGNELYGRTNEEDSHYLVDVIIYPFDKKNEEDSGRKIVLKPKFFETRDISEMERIGWDKSSKKYNQIWELMKDLEVEELIINYNGMDYNFDATISYNNQELDYLFASQFKMDLYGIISQMLKTKDWSQAEGGHGTLLLHNNESDSENTAELYHNWVVKDMNSGEPIILTEKDFE